MGKTAAFFDLDRTLLGGASAPVISSALKTVGLMPDRSIPGEELLFKVFNTIGETWPAMMLTRQGARMAKGWSRDKACEAGRLAALELVQQVQPFAHGLIEEHRANGRLVVMATTTPYDVIKPLADALEFDEVIATKYGLDGKDRYDGTIDGDFVWGAGKLRAIKVWAEQHDVDLSESYAYSDSFYDNFLLGAVGHPFAVNPDPRLRLMAVARRWPTLFLDVPPGVPKFAGLEPQQIVIALARTIGSPELLPYARFDIQGVEKIPSKGPAIIVGNHRSYFDPMAIGYTLAKAGRPARFLGKKEVFDAPIVGDLARAMGGIRVERGTGSDDPLHEAAMAIDAGEMVTIMPQGTIPRGMAFFDPVLKGRWGAARLAAMTKAPIIPIGLWGTELVWPRNSRVPHMWNVTSPPGVRVRVGDPVEVGYEDPDADTEAIMSALVDLLPAEARTAREPTPEELARSLPAGWTDAPETEHELNRRPGTD